VLPGFISQPTATADLLLASLVFGVFLLGSWIVRNPARFWDQFNPYLKPYGKTTLALGRTIGALWAFGAVLGCLVLVGNAIRDAGRHLPH
jgi:hypothetical protein